MLLPLYGSYDEIIGFKPRDFYSHVKLRELAKEMRTEDAIEFITKRMDIPVKTWMENSAVLRQVTRQKRLV